MGEVLKPFHRLLWPDAIPERWVAGLSMLLPMWERSGRPRDLVTAAATLAEGAADWTEGPAGVGRVYDGSSTDDLPDHPQTRFGAGDMAVLAVFRMSGVIDGQINTIISNGVSGASLANRGWKITVNSFNSSDRIIGFQADSFISSAANSIQDGQLHVVLVTRQSGVVRLYLDGQQLASGNFPGDWDFAGALRTRHGAMADSSGFGDTFHFGGDLHLTAAWKGRHMTQADATAFSRDPYALLRGTATEQLAVPMLPVAVTLTSMAAGAGTVVIGQ